VYNTIEKLLCKILKENKKKIENEYAASPIFFFCENLVIRMKIKPKTLIS